MGCQPSFAFAKGDIKSSKAGSIVRKSGMWALEARKQAPADLDAQVAEIFSRLPEDPAVWARFREEFEVDMFCGFWMCETDEGMIVSAQTMKILADRGISLGFCVYAPLPDGGARVQPGASPNVGPADPLGNSGVGGRPPSVT